MYASTYVCTYVDNMRSRIFSRLRINLMFIELSQSGWLNNKPVKLF